MFLGFNGKRFSHLMAACLSCAAGIVVAADSKSAPPATGTKPQPAVAAPAQAAAPRPDEAERKKVINSPQWRAMQHDLMEWLSVQQVYTPSRLRKVKAELNAKVARMGPEELVEFMQDMEAKLKIMMSPEADKARVWVERRLATQVNFTPEQLKQMRPDVLNMTTAQLENTLAEWQTQRQHTVRVQEAFDRGRKQEVKNIEAMEKDEEHERDEALNRAYYESGNGSPYGSYYGGTLNNPTWFRGGGAYYPSYRW